MHHLSPSLWSAEMLLQRCSVPLTKKRSNLFLQSLSLSNSTYLVSSIMVDPSLQPLLSKFFLPNASISTNFPADVYTTRRGATKHHTNLQPSSSVRAVILSNFKPGKTILLLYWTMNGQWIWDAQEKLKTLRLQVACKLIAHQQVATHVDGRGVKASNNFQVIEGECSRQQLNQVAPLAEQACKVLLHIHAVHLPGTRDLQSLVSWTKFFL